MAITKVGGTPKQVQQTTALKGLQSIAPINVSKVKSQSVIMAEELIEIHTYLSGLEAFTKLKRLDELKKGLQQVMADSGADEKQPYVFHTDSGSAEFGPCSNTTEIIDKVAMIKALGMDTFKEIAKVGITDLRTYLSANEIEQFTAHGFGSRSLKSVVVK